jgi:hypothetical protein
MKIYLSSATQDFIEVDNTTKLTFCQDDKKPLRGISVGINYYFPNSVYIEKSEELKVLPRAYNTIIVE